MNNILIIYGKGKAMNHMCKFLEYIDISYIQMDDYDADVDLIISATSIIVTPGIKPSHRLYKEHGTKIVSELSFIGQLIATGYFPRWDNVQTIGITGTNGKSTTTRVLYQVIEHIQLLHDISDRSYVHIGGNFDMPLSGIILSILQNHTTTEKHIIVLECSSFMLWKLQDFRFTIGLLLNIAPDHIDRHGSMDDYLESKLNILTHANVALTQPEIISSVHKKEMRGLSFIRKRRPFSKHSDQTKQRLRYEPLVDFHHPAFLGAHNASNFGAVDKILQVMYGDVYKRSLIEDIQPMAHRLQPLQISPDLTIIDDSVCSSAHSLGAALDAMTEKVILIAGGYDNGENYRGLLDKFRDKVMYAIFYGQTRVVMYPLAKQVGVDSSMVETLEDAFASAGELAKKNHLTTILYSPGAKSFDQFDNVYHRIRVFEGIVEEMKR